MKKKKIIKTEIKSEDFDMFSKYGVKEIIKGNKIFIIKNKKENNEKI